MPFKTATFEFDNGTSLHLERQAAESRKRKTGDSIEESTLEITLSTPAGEPVISRLHGEKSATRARAVAHFLESFAPVSQVGADSWSDLETGEIFSTDEVIERYSSLLPEDVARRPRPIDPEIDQFLKGLPVHLIETQRLLTNEVPARIAGGRRPARSKVTVEAFSDDFSRRMREALAQNSRASQERDRTFPRRLLSAGGAPPQATEDAIRERYDQQSRLRSELAEISLLQQAATELPLPDRELDDWERLVLWTYLEDSDRKLATFEDILRRVKLFRDIVNSRFLFKTLKISRDGFAFVTQAGQDISARGLSSGEQHELVLTYDLLFNVEPNSLVLIDEPEISLHVAWQQEFLNDIARIAETASLRFVVATHSPQVIHKWWKRTVALGPEL
ncbi:AAA family ATPase [Kitasatospora purpeofusca]|uniref:AAA family ATPase n=1 Tax=Kitasatospora purpeofusca TaxID=67352 RepID=UPI0036A123AA